MHAPLIACADTGRNPMIRP